MGIGLLLVLVLISAATGCTAVWDTGATEDKKQSGAQTAEEPVVLHVYNTMGENINTEQAEAYIHRTMPDNNYQKAYSDKFHFLPLTHVQSPIHYIPYKNLNRQL